jgi:AraC-like DNA-binding protein
VSKDSGEAIIRELERFLSTTSLLKVHFAEGSTAPPSLAYVTHFPRLSIPLDGCHRMEVARNGRIETINLIRGEAVFVPANGWNKPDWSSAVHVLTFLFGKKQAGVSLVLHDGGAETPVDALKTSIHGTYDSLTQGLVSALTTFAADNPSPPLDRLLTQSLLYSCLRLLKTPEPGRARKALRTHEAICLYLQENYQNTITRESVAQHFRLAPNHISRLFRQEGFMRFNDYLNMVRVSRAKFMLRNYRQPLKEVAASCGYQETAYFCRVFKKINKVTPTQYRSAH